MNNPIIFTVLGVPVPKGRPRIAIRGGFARAYTPAKTRDYESLLAGEGKVAMRSRKPLEGALKVEIKAYLPIPKAASKRLRMDMRNNVVKHVKKPDADNLFKVVDALNGICWHDDNQIVDANIQKFYSDEPRLEVYILEL